MARLWLKLMAWLSKCSYCGASGAKHNVCDRKECIDKATEWQSFAP